MRGSYKVAGPVRLVWGWTDAFGRRRELLPALGSPAPLRRWFLRAETLKAADRAIVDYHHRLELSGVWGDASHVSSDGKRWGVQGNSLLAGFYPRYFGYYDRAFTLYSHVSDQFSGFGARGISCSPREALYVLDGLLENDTILRPHEHYTDTHGATEHLFGMCHLLGFSFMPRLKDSASVPCRSTLSTAPGRTVASIHFSAARSTSRSCVSNGTRSSASPHR
jgi:hypothetical protein